MASPRIPPITPPAIAPAEDEELEIIIYAPLIKLINDKSVPDRQRNRMNWKQESEKRWKHTI